MPDLNLDEIEKTLASEPCSCQRYLVGEGRLLNEPCSRCKYIHALVAEVKRLREEHRMLHRVECNHTSQPIGGPGCICVVANKYAEERIADNALEEAAKICEKVAGVFEFEDRYEDAEWCAKAPRGCRECAEKIRALKTNKGE